MKHCGKISFEGSVGDPKDIYSDEDAFNELPEIPEYTGGSGPVTLVGTEITKGLLNHLYINPAAFSKEFFEKFYTDYAADLVSGGYMIDFKKIKPEGSSTTTLAHDMFGSISNPEHGIPAGLYQIEFNLSNVEADPMGGKCTMFYNGTGAEISVEISGLPLTIPSGVSRLTIDEETFTLSCVPITEVTDLYSFGYTGGTVTHVDEETEAYIGKTYSHNDALVGLFSMNDAFQGGVTDEKYVLKAVNGELTWVAEN